MPLTTSGGDQPIKSSAVVASEITDETGTGKVVFDTSPTLVTPNLGTPTTLVATNATGTAAGLTAGAATVLATARTINGVSFNGSANIIIDTDDTLLLQQALGSTVQVKTGSVRNVTTLATLADGVANFEAIYIPNAKTITGVKWWQIAQGDYTADNNNYVALYSYSGGTLTQVAISTNNGNIWKVAGNSLGSADFASPYSAAAGVYFVAALYNNSAQNTAPSLACHPNQNSGFGVVDFTNSAALHATLAAQTALTTPIAASALTPLQTGNFWWGLY